VKISFEDYHLKVCMEGGFLEIAITGRNLASMPHRLLKK
jgi:hypothetical protein